MTTYSGVDNFPASVTIPDDSAAPTAANLLVSIEGALDRTTYLKNRTGSHRVVAIAAAVVNDGADALAPVVLGGSGNTVTFNSTAYTGSATALPLAAISGTLVNDIIEFELTGTLTASGGIVGSWLKVVALDSTLFDVQGAKVYVEQNDRVIALPATVDDGVSGAFTARASWNTAAFATPYTVETIPNLLLGDIVDTIGTQFVSLTSLITPSNHTGILQLQSQENAAAAVNVAGARYQVQDIAGSPLVQATFDTRHVMAAAGTLTLSVLGKVDVVADSANLHLEAPISYMSTVHRPGTAAIPFVLTGRYVATHAGTLSLGLDGKVGAAGTVLSAIGSLNFQARVWRVNPP